MWIRVLSAILIIFLMVNVFSNILGSSSKSFEYALNRFSKLNSSFDSTFEMFQDSVEQMQETDELAFAIIDIVDKVDFEKLLKSSSVVGLGMPVIENFFSWVGAALNHVYTLLSLIPKGLVYLCYMLYCSFLFLPVIITLGSDVAEYAMKFLSLMFDLILRDDTMIDEPDFPWWDEETEEETGNIVQPLSLQFPHQPAGGGGQGARGSVQILDSDPRFGSSIRILDSDSRLRFST